MKRLLLVCAALLLTAGLVWADAFTGPAAQSHQVTVTVIVPNRVGIDIAAGEHTKLLDLQVGGWYPPAAATDTVIGTNIIRILSTGNYDYAYTAVLATAGNMVLGDLQYQGNAWTPEAGAGWHAFLAAEALDGTPGTPSPKTPGWVYRSLDYRVNIDGAETPGNHIWTLTYTVTPQ